jgi:hypothetical protein
MKAADWITADDSIIAPMVKEAAAKYAAEKNITTHHHRLPDDKLMPPCNAGRCGLVGWHPK